MASAEGCAKTVRNTAAVICWVEALRENVGLTRWHYPKPVQSCSSSSCQQAFTPTFSRRAVVGRQRFLYDSPRRRYTLCRAALRSVLCAELGCQNRHLAFETSEHGKPYARVRWLHAPISFNVNHSGAHGLISVSPRGRIGVDVEECIPRPNIGLLMESVLTPEEQAELAAMRGHRKLRAFFSLWTFKEALSKAHGMGLSLDVARFEVPPAMRSGERSGVFHFADLSESEWRLDNLDSADFAAALAHEQA